MTTKHYPQLATLLIFSVIAFRAGAGTLFYVSIPASESDPNSGISSENTYTTAIDGGNAQGADRVINGITLYALTGEGQSISANNCFLNVLEGTIANGGGAAETIQADGTVSEVASDMTFNNEANDGSQQEIVLDPASLTPGTTYDLRVYVCNPSGQNREVNLTFAGDGEAPVETGWFNEDDATTSAGGFQDPNQVYYINYRYTWDGDTTPGITISQRYGRTPFCLYALTNQVVPGAGAAAATGAGAGEEAAAEGGEEGLSAGYVNVESDEVGVASDDFYSSESLNSNGRWIKLDKWGTSWQPTNVPAGWSPYTNGSWKDCDDCGWIFDSPEPWAWACYHYGRWAKVRTGCGWAWVPGKVWGASWVSWRQGRSGSSCETCIGWAPLPPEADCELGVGISSWVDYTSDIGPDCYTFINIRDFGSDSYSGCGTCIIDRGTYINIVEQTTNITNISYDKHVNIYSGGPDYNWCNTQIRKYGGKECEKVHVNRYDDPGKLGGKYAQKQGNQLGLVSPKIKDNKNAKQPKVAESLGSDKIDKGWGSAKANNKEKELKNHIAQETRGKTPKNTKGTLPPGVASQMAKGPGASARQGQKPGAAGQLGKGLPKGAVLHQPGAKQRQPGAASAFDAKKGLAAQPGTKPGRPGERSAQKGIAGQPGAKAGQSGQAGEIDARKGLAASPGSKVGQVGKPGQRVGKKGLATPSGKAADAGKLAGPDTKQGLAGQAGMRPGQSLKKTGPGQAGLDAQKKEGPQRAKQGAQAQGFQPGKQEIQGKGQGVQQGQAQKGLQGGKPSAGAGSPHPGRAGQPTAEQKGRGIQQGKAPSAGVAKEPGAGTQGAKQTQEAKPGQAAQKKEGQADQALKQQQQKQLQQQQAQQQQKPPQQQQAQHQQQKVERQHREAQQEKQLQQQKQAQQQQQQKLQQQQRQQPQKQSQERQAQQQQKQLQQQRAQQQQKQLQHQQAQQQQKQLQHQQAQQQQRQLQHQQAQQQQRQLQQQQAQQQQRQLQQQQAQQQKQGGKKGKQTPTPWPY